MLRFGIPPSRPSERSAGGAESKDLGESRETVARLHGFPPALAAAAGVISACGVARPTLFGQRAGVPRLPRGPVNTIPVVANLTGILRLRRFAPPLRMTWGCGPPCGGTQSDVRSWPGGTESIS